MITDDGLILENETIADETWRMRVRSALAPLAKPGQFVQIQVPGFYLRRPISVCFAKDDVISFVYKVVGDGTKALSHMKPGHTLSLFGPLGSGFPIEQRDVLLIGGGVGTPPMLYTASEYLKKNVHVSAVLGFNDAKSVMLEKEFRDLGCDVYVATMDGSYGTKGTVIDAIQKNGLEENFVLACGPLPMLKAVSAKYGEGYVSLESRMACGMGACMGCVVKDQNGEALRVCKDGPVFAIGKVVL